ncbi:hypothetical protein PMI42_04887 [Bradyrhizobium sp. YR681]|uniref:hypothetical protein n=1 Tax=Bradyrhizobium sp. YR681 TaxID=1144344 RepID=UPI00027114A4|nr:hypothetical protein [Bradyrhizobium sp. YR681]EJN11872.1 hypothetical protein PMI42_04887 [Bradyrhizobium sp. YR681]
MWGLFVAALLLLAGIWCAIQRLRGLAAVLIAVALSLLVTKAFARDDGRYANSALKPWFDSLRSGKGPCCSDADGYVLSEVDWESADGRYRVRVPISNDEADNNVLIWVDVPEDAVITEPNRAGRTMVWPIWGFQGPTIRCFMPGSMT